jgi:translation elongation factor EF-1beta
MGKVMAVYKLLMDSPEQDVNSVKDRLRGMVAGLSEIKLTDTREEEVAFGLRALVCTFVVPDQGDWLNKLEDGFTTLPGIGSFEPLSVSLL